MAGTSLLCSPISPVVNLGMSSTARLFVEMQYMGAQAAMLVFDLR